MNDAVKIFCLQEELQIAESLLVRGFGELQEIRMDNDCYHLPQQLLASGLERLMKCYFCLVYEARNGQFPDNKFLKDLSHDLDKLLQTFANDYYNQGNRPLLVSDLQFLKTDSELKKIIHVLSEFGKTARYYNLDIVTGSPKPPIDPNAEWEELERELVDPVPYMTPDSMEALFRDYYPRVNAAIIAKLERLLRAIAMQFTLGDHGGRLQQMSNSTSRFRKLHDEDFGTVDYRQSIEMVRHNWVERSTEEILNSGWPTRRVTQAEFDGDWPFRSEDVVVECRDEQFCIINIKGYDFALNGAAKSRFGFPDPHEAGVAIIGKSIGPFRDLAFSLASTASKP